MPRRQQVLLTALFAIAAVAGTAWISVVAAATWPPVDYSVFGRPGADILTLQWGRVFADPVLQAGPFELMVWGIPFLLQVEGVTAWAIYYAAVGLVIAAAFGYVVFRLVRPVAADLAAPLGAFVAAAAVLSTTIVQTIESGHPSESVVPLMWIVAGVLARRDRPALAAGLVGLTAGWELWGLLGLPVLLLAPRIRWRTVLWSAVGGVAALLVVFGPFALAGPVNMFGYAWLVREGTLVHLLLPDAETFPWPVRVAQGAVALGAGAAAAWFLRGMRDAVWLVPLASLAVRLLTDPILAGYYYTPAILLALAGLALALAQRSLARLVLVVVLLNAMIDFTTLGWIGAAATLAATVVTIVVVASRRRRETLPAQPAAEAHLPVAASARRASAGGSAD